MTNRTFMTVEEVAAELGVSKSYAYKIVKPCIKTTWTPSSVTVTPLFS